MTKKYSFDSKQPEVSVFAEGTKFRYFILENEKTETVFDQMNENSKPRVEYVYDATEFAEEADILDPEKVKADPKAYVDYTPVIKAATANAPTLSLESRIATLEDLMAEAIGG